MADPRDYPIPEFMRDISKPLGYAAIAVVLFLTVLIASFPYADALSTMLAPYGLKIDYQDQRMSLPFGAALDNVRLSYAAMPGAPVIVQSRTVTLAPTLGALLLGRPGLRIRADLYDGMIRATISRSGELTDLSFSVNHVELARFQALSLFALSGSISGKGSIELDGAKVLDSSGQLHLSGKRLSVRFAPAMAPVELDAASGTLAMNHGLVAIEKLEGHGADLAITANGTIQLVQHLPESTVDLSFTLNPTPAGRRDMAMLLGLLPHPPNLRPYTLRGPLLLPSIS